MYSEHRFVVMYLFVYLYLKFMHDDLNSYLSYLGCLFRIASS